MLIGGITIREELSSELLSGQIDTLVLYLLSMEDSYGLDLYNKLKVLTQHRVKIKQTTLYSCYKRLEVQNYITSYWGDETNGARRRYYSITQLGKEQLQTMAGVWKELFKILLSVYETIESD